jgi:hypothetical protein
MVDTLRVSTAASPRRMGDIFVDRGLITAEQLAEALAAQRDTDRKLGEILVEKGYISRITLAGVITAQWNDRGVTATSRKANDIVANAEVVAQTSVVETALRERLESLTAEVTTANARIVQQAGTIDALLQRIKDLEAALAAAA